MYIEWYNNSSSRAKSNYSVERALIICIVGSPRGLKTPIQSPIQMQDAKSPAAVFHAIMHACRGFPMLSLSMLPQFRTRAWRLVGLTASFSCVQNNKEKTKMSRR